MAPIVKEWGKAGLLPAQIDIMRKRGLKVALTYRDGKRRRIKKGMLRIAGCECCGKWLEFEPTGAFSEPDASGWIRQVKPIRVVSFTDLSAYTAA
jgi:hypothetical protein